MVSGDEFNHSAALTKGCFRAFIGIRRPRGNGIPSRSGSRGIISSTRPGVTLTFLRKWVSSPAKSAGWSSGTPRNFFRSILAFSLTGAIPSVLAYPNSRLHPEKFRHGLEGMARSSGLDLLLTEHSLDEAVRPLVEGECSSIQRVLFPVDWKEETDHMPFAVEDFERMHARLRDRVYHDAPCLLQHSSGTTGLQKGVMLSHHAVGEHLQRYGKEIEVNHNEDVVVSWLPLYHDMGLIAAFHLPMYHGVPVVQIDPFEWVTAPAMMLEAISKEKGTLAWLPNFALNLMANRLRDDVLEGIRLESLRLLVNFSEPVRPDSHERFTRRFVPYGLRPEALSCCYAMAETTFAVTQTEIGICPRVLKASASALAKRRFQPAAGEEPVRECLSSGRLIAGCHLRVVDETGEEVPEGSIGELELTSVSLFSGYRNNPEKTAETLDGGWFRSGDLGFAWEGECFVIGREKDMIIVAGKNLYPEDIESVVSQVEGILPGRAVAIGAENADIGTEEIWIVAETREEDPTARRHLDLEVRKAGMAMDVTISRVELVAPRWLFKSSAGKPMRKANKDRLLKKLKEGSAT